MGKFVIFKYNEVEKPLYLGLFNDGFGFGSIETSLRFPTPSSVWTFIDNNRSRLKEDVKDDKLYVGELAAHIFDYIGEIE